MYAIPILAVRCNYFVIMTSFGQELFGHRGLTPARDRRLCDLDNGQRCNGSNGRFVVLLLNLAVHFTAVRDPPFIQPVKLVPLYIRQHMCATHDVTN